VRQTVTRLLEFDAGHRLLKHEGKCSAPHGHRYRLEVTVSAEQLDVVGRVVDFGVIKALIGGWIDTFLDHGMVLEVGDPLIALLRAAPGPPAKIFELHTAPTAENLLWMFYDVVGERLEGHGLTLIQLRLYETPNCWAEIRV